MYNSNTTLVKVKLHIEYIEGKINRNSNTTLVKVKFGKKEDQIIFLFIQIQLLLKLNEIILSKLEEPLVNSNTTLVKVKSIKSSSRIKTR